MKAGIYYIKNLINNKIYIGQGLDAIDRMNKGHKECNALAAAIKKYGIGNFEKGIICYCFAEELGTLEKYYIEKWNSLVPNGYNIATGGKAPMEGRKHSKSSRKKISKNNAKNMLGKHHSPDIIKKLSEAHTGFRHSIETLKKMSKSHSGKTNGFYSRKHSDATKAIMSEKAKIRCLNPSLLPWFGKKKRGSSSQYFGVHISRDGKYEYWKACLTVDHKRIYIGSFNDEIDAAIYYDQYVLEHHLPNPINFAKR